MILTILKYSIIIICSFYMYLKLLNISINHKLCMSCIPFLLLCFPLIYFLRKFAAPFSIFAIVIIFACFVSKVVKTPPNLSLTVSTFSFGLAYSDFLIAAAIMSILGYFISLLIHEPLSDLCNLICIGIIQFLLSTVLFKIKRLKKGMPFLLQYGSHDVGVYISVLLLIAISFFGISKKPNLVYIIPTFLSFACGLTLLFWWKNCISKNYREKVKAKETEELQKTILEQNGEIEQLKYHNNELAKIIHKDNKLIPAMEFAVREYLLSAEYETDKEERLNRAKELLDQLKGMSQERYGILKYYESKSKTLPTTDILSIDTLMSYMLQKSNEYQIDFDLSVSGSIKYLIKNMITELDIKTLLADLIDNAIIATKKCNKKKILVNIGISNDYYTIDVYDSGEPFATETFQTIGLKRTTTHLNDGGSGIGLMTTFEILRKYQASFEINESISKNLFTKKVSVHFDHLGQFRIKAKNINEMKLLSKRNDIVLIDDKNSKKSMICKESSN